MMQPTPLFGFDGDPGVLPEDKMGLAWVTLTQASHYKVRSEPFLLLALNRIDRLEPIVKKSNRHNLYLMTGCVTNHFSHASGDFVFPI